MLRRPPGALHVFPIEVGQFRLEGRPTLLGGSQGSLQRGELQVPSGPVHLAIHLRDISVEAEEPAWFRLDCQAPVGPHQNPGHRLLNRLPDFTVHPTTELLGQSLRMSSDPDVKPNPLETRSTYGHRASGLPASY